MAVTFGSSAVTGTGNNVLTLSFSVTTVSADTRLLVMVGNTVNSVLPTGVTYNGVSLTADGSTPSGFNLSFWHIDSFTAGTFNVVVSIPGGPVGIAATAIPLRGAGLSLAPVVGTSSTSTGTAASCAVSGAGSGDLQLAQCAASTITGLVSAGSPQFLVPGPSLPALDGQGHTYGFDYVTLGSAGNFAWTLGSSGVWLAQGVTIFAIPPFTPFTSTQFFVTDTIIQQ